MTTYSPNIPYSGSMSNCDFTMRKLGWTMRQVALNSIGIGLNMSGIDNASETAQWLQPRCQSVRLDIPKGLRLPLFYLLPYRCATLADRSFHSLFCSRPRSALSAHRFAWSAT